ncbi:L-asparagine transporter-like permease [Paenibacillus methanolicus]|uniref:L-asparagine transporter-like permease n=2 Tax=Paenibacillus methanolicus TaxID=582686 RepID=A0A5S5BP58_9BACL|nr:L-asparagine transporter-like permease [Paenibacillus methanolicus]
MLGGESISMGTTSQNNGAASSEGNKEQTNTKLKWWQLSLLGVAFTIGTGFFLGSGLAIQIGGPGVLICFLLAAVGTYLVFDVLAQMTSLDPLEGSFRSYAKKAFGRWAGFSSGWVYWSSELLIMGSQLTALSLFSKLWFPNVPMWLLAIVYAILGLFIVWLGTKGFERFESMFAMIKVSAIIMFIALAACALMGWLHVGQVQAIPNEVENYFPHGAMGLWASLLFAFYAFGGIEIMGIMAMRLQEPRQAPRAGKMMLVLLTVVYFISLVFAMILVSWKKFNGDQSPFLLALKRFDIPYVPDLFNATLIIAGFSTMTASLFAIIKMLVILAKDGDAPHFITIVKLKRPVMAIVLTAAGMALSIIFSLLMPGKVYEYITTAAGLMLLYNWMFILITSGRLLKLTTFGKIKRYAGLLILLGAVSGSVFHSLSRPGFFISLGFVTVIGGLTLYMNSKWRLNSVGTNSTGSIIGALSPKHQVNGFKSKIKSKANK